MYKDGIKKFQIVCQEFGLATDWSCESCQNTRI